MAIRKITQHTSTRKPSTETNQPPKPTDGPVPVTASLRHGALFVYGIGSRLRVVAGHLWADWGIADDRYTARIPRAGGELERIVTVGVSGYLTFDVMRWCRDQDVSLILLERDGSLINVISPGRPADAALRRAQFEATINGKNLLISRELIARKLIGQLSLVRDRLKDEAAAAKIERLCDSLAGACSLDAVRVIEAAAGVVYWGRWASVELRFPRRDLDRIPQRWQVVGSRTSRLTDGPKKATSPFHAALNFLNAVARSEVTIGLSSLGMDPSVGYLHADIPGRDSLSLDVLEFLWPDIETWLYDWISGKTLSRTWFHELPDGECRMSLDLCRELSGTAHMWRVKIAPICEWLTEVLDGRKVTPLSKRRARESHGNSLALRAAGPEMSSFCAECGTSIAGRQYCDECLRPWNTERLRKIFTSGVAASRDPRVISRRKETNAKQVAARSRWNPACLPQWLSPEVYDQEIRPRLPNVTTSAIVKKLSVSSSYAVKIRRGQNRPHPRFWLPLAQLLGYTPQASQPFASAVKA
jgi:CRISPR-associated endonuclease Cas1